MFVPKKTPRDVVGPDPPGHRQRDEHRDTKRARFAKLGVEPMIMTPEAFDARIARETKIAVELAKATGLAK